MKKALHLLSLQWVHSTSKIKQGHFLTNQLETICSDVCKPVSKQYTSTKKQVLKTEYAPGWFLFTIFTFPLSPKPEV